jgi:hypothetical protein
MRITFFGLPHQFLALSIAGALAAFGTAACAGHDASPVAPSQTMTASSSVSTTIGSRSGGQGGDHGNTPGDDRGNTVGDDHGNDAGDDRGHDAGDDHGVDRAELTGAIASRRGTCPELSFMVGTAVSTTRTTAFEDAACSALQNGDRVEVSGALANGSVVASRVERKE